MKNAIVLLVALVAPHSAKAAFTDFSDLTVFDTFEVGETINSNGVSIDVVLYLSPSSFVLVSGSEGGISPPPRLSFGGVGLDLQIPMGTNEVSFLYDDDARAELFINGVEAPNGITSGYVHLDGLTIGGVTISVDQFPDDSPFSGDGEMSLFGSINSLLIRGVELSIDDVSIRIPEPGVPTMLLVACVLATALRRRSCSLS